MQLLRQVKEYENLSINMAGINQGDERLVVCVLTEQGFMSGIKTLSEATRVLIGWGANVRFLLLVEAKHRSSGLVNSVISDAFGQTSQIEYQGCIHKNWGKLKSADLLCLPDDGWANNSSLVLELARLGLPMIATNQMQSRDIIKHGFNGLLIPSNNGFALAESLFSMIRCSNRWLEMQINAMEIRSRMCEIGKKIRNYNDASIFNY